MGKHGHTPRLRLAALAGVPALVGRRLAGACRAVWGWMRRHRILTAFGVFLMVVFVSVAPSLGLWSTQKAAAATLTPDNDPSDLILGLPTSVLQAMAGGNNDVAAQLANLARYSPDIAKAADKLTAGSIDMTEFEKEISQTGSRWSVPDFVDEAEQLNTGAASARANVVILGGLVGYNGARAIQGMAFNRDNTLCTAYAAGGTDGALAYGQAWADNILSTGLWQSPVTSGKCPKSQYTDEQLEAQGRESIISVLGATSSGVTVTGIRTSSVPGYVCYSADGPSSQQNAHGSFSWSSGGKSYQVVFRYSSNGSIYNGVNITETHSTTNYGYGCPIGLASTGMTSVSQVLVGIATISSGVVVDEADGTHQPNSVRGTTTVKCTDGASVPLVSSVVAQDASTVSNPVPSGSECADHGDIDSIDLGVQQQASDGSWTDMPDGKQTLKEPDVVRDWKTQYPQCTSGGCKLDLKKITGGDTELDCFDDPDECLDWKENTSQYRCYYAGQVVDLAECNIYAKVFDQNAVQQGQGYANPETGESPKTNTDPDTGGQTEINTNPGAQEFDSTEGDPLTSEDAQNAKCWPSGWGVFNPFQWVYMPVKCALRWAFVPRKTVIQQQTATAVDTWANTPPGVVAGLVGGLPGMLPHGDSSCQGPHLVIHENVGLPLDIDGYPLQACDGSMKTLAAICTVVTGGLVLWGTLFALTRIIGNIVHVKGIGGSDGGSETT